MVTPRFPALLMVVLLTFYGFGQNVVVDGVALANAGGGPGNCTANGYKLKGTAVGIGSCASLTQSTFDAGAMWICDPINLNESFKVYFEANFDVFNSGDGIAFVLQTEGVPNVLGAEGGGIGYSYGNLTGCLPAGDCVVDPSVIVEFDIWDNSADFWNVAIPVLGTINDVSCDHATILVDANQTLGGTLAGPDCLLPGNAAVTDGLPHDICIIWDVINLEYSVYFDSVLVTAYNGDIRTNFVDPTNVSWGFTAGSGGANQNQRVCNVDMVTNPVNPTCVCLFPIASYTPVPVEICSVEATSIALSSTIVGTSFEWSAANNANVTGESTVPQSGAFISDVLTNLSATDQIINYTVTPNSAGCIGTDLIIPVTVHPTPLVLGTLTTCVGSTTTLTGSGTANAINPWVSNDPTIATVDNSGLVTGLLVGSSDITYLDNNNCQVTVTVIVNAAEDASFTTIDFCEGSASPVATITGSLGGTFAYNPNPADGSNVNPSTGSITGGVGGTTYSIEYTTSGSCPASSVETVTVIATPQIDAGPDQAVCDGDQIVLSGSGATVYNWDNGAVDGVVFTPVLGTTTYTLTVNAANGCVVTDQLNVVVNPLPTVSAGNDFTICDGVPAVLNGSGALSYVWTPGAVIDGQPFSLSSTSNYTVTGTDLNGCLNTDDITITVEPSPIVSFTADVIMGCAPLTVTFTNTTAGTLSDCLWSLSNGTVLSGCDSVTTTFQDGGLYDVTLTTASINGCVTSETYIDYINVDDGPTAAFMPTPSSVSVFNPEVLLINNSTGAVNYVWDFGDSAGTSIAVNPSYTYDAVSATYQVQLIAYSVLGCTDTAWFSFVVNEELLFYLPNTFTPDGDEFNQMFKAIFTRGYDPFDFNFYIYNRWGQLIWESHNAEQGWDGVSNVSKKPVQDGSYVWKIDFKTLTSDERVEVIGHVNVLR